MNTEFNKVNVIRLDLQYNRVHNECKTFREAHKAIIMLDKEGMNKANKHLTPSCMGEG